MASPGITIVAGTDLPYHFLYGTLPGYALVAVDQELSYKPSGYDRADSYLTGEWDGSVRLFRQSKSGRSWYFPSGLLAKVTGVLDIFGVTYTVQDAAPREFDPQGFVWVSPLTLRPYQEEIVKKAYAAEGGVISLPTGGGKTLVGLKLISLFDMPTLIACHTRELLYQWRDEIKLHLGVDAGLVGDGNKDFQAITVATLQTIGGMVRSGEIQRLEYGMLLIDECLPYSTPVITDVGELPIGEIVEKHLPVKVLTHAGQFKRILGYQKIPLVKRLVRVTHEYGDLVCTEDHKILTQRGWIEAGKLTNEDVLYYVGEEDVRVRGMWERVLNETRAGETQRMESQKCMEGRGVFDGRAAAVDSRECDGGYVYPVPASELRKSDVVGCSFGRPSRLLTVEVLESDKSRKNAAAVYGKPGVRGREEDYPLLYLGVPMSYSNLQFGVSMRGTHDNRRFVKRDKYTNRIVDVVLGRRVASEKEESSRGWVCWTQGFNFARKIFAGGVGSDCPVVGQNVGGQCKCVLLQKGNLREYWADFGCGCISRDCAPDCTTGRDGLQGDSGLYVYDITVEDDHSFVANGVVVHNCHRIPANVAYNIAMRCTARKRYGLSATPRRQDNAVLKIFAATGPLTSVITPCDLIKAGYLARPKLTMISVGGSPMYFSQDWQKEYVSHIVTNDERNRRIVDEVVRLVREGKQTYIHVERIEHMELLYNLIVKEVAPTKVARIWGKVKTADRQKLLKRFEAGTLNVLIGTILKEGVNLPAMDAVVLAGGLSSPVALVQKVGRALRRNERFDYAEVIDFIDNCGRFCRKHSELRYQAFMEYYGDCIEIVRA